MEKCSNQIKNMLNEKTKTKNLTESNNRKEIKKTAERK